MHMAQQAEEGLKEAPWTEVLRTGLDELRTFIQQEIRLVGAEISEKVKQAGMGAGMFGAAAVLGLFAVGFLAAAGAAALAIVLPTWAAIVIVGGLFAVAAVVALLIARRRIRGAPLAPEATKRTLQEDVRWAREQIRR
jgi:hypothetical protein